MSDELVHIASFDIGKKNFAFYIEEVNLRQLKELEDIPNKKDRYNEDGTISDVFKPLLECICNNGKVILYQNVDLTKNVQSNNYMDDEYYHNMTDVLDNYKEYWDKCNVFVIEKQMAFGKNKNNIMALRLGQHCWSYFACRYGRDKSIVEFPAYHKTQILGAEKIKTGNSKYKPLTKPQRKKWCVQKAKNILLLRNDTETLTMINSIKKKDDLADVLCQLQAYKVNTYIE